MSAVLEIALAVLLVAGSFFILVGALGLVKLSDVFRRLHAPTKASTLGVGCVLLASMGEHLLRGEGLQPRELLITVFLFMTAPISAHLIAKAALALMPRFAPPPPPADQPERERLTAAKPAPAPASRQTPAAAPRPRHD